MSRWYQKLQAQIESEKAELRDLVYWYRARLRDWDRRLREWQRGKEQHETNGQAEAED